MKVNTRDADRMRAGRLLAPLVTGLLVTALRRGQHLAHVAGNARHAEQSRFPVKRRLDLFHRQAVVPLDVQQDARIDRAGARGHHQPFQGREAHGGIDTAAAAHRRGGAAVAQVADYQAQSSADRPSISAARRLQ